jgi:hypothetical protein
MEGANRKYQTCRSGMHGISEDTHFLGSEAVIVAGQFAIV